jgi:hypothetical protein
MSARLANPAEFIAPSAPGGVPLYRLYALRFGYLLLVVGLGSEIWPLMFHHSKPWDLMHGVADCMLAALSACAVIGLRYPLKMLPLLFFEIAWKTIWLVVVALPLWRAHHMDDATLETTRDCLMGVIFPLMIPWPYVFANYVKSAGDRWR